MAFRVGERVVAVGARIPGIPHLGAPWVLTRPKAREIVTIRAIENHPIDGEPGIRLVEHVNPTLLTTVGPYEVMFHPACFRKLVTASQAQDIAMIRELVETIDPIVACELTYADEIEARMERIDRLWEAMR